MCRFFRDIQQGLEPLHLQAVIATDSECHLMSEYFAHRVRVVLGVADGVTAQPSDLCAVPLRGRNLALPNSSLWANDRGDVLLVLHDVEKHRTEEPQFRAIHRAATGEWELHITEASYVNAKLVRWLLILLAQAPLELVHIHGSLLTSDDHRVLLIGSSGAGKTSMTLALLDAGFRLFTDDATFVARSGFYRLLPSGTSVVRIEMEQLSLCTRLAQMVDSDSDHLIRISARRDSKFEIDLERHLSALMEPTSPRNTPTVVLLDEESSVDGDWLRTIWKNAWYENTRLLETILAHPECVQNWPELIEQESKSGTAKERVLRETLRTAPVIHLPKADSALQRRSRLLAHLGSAL